MQLRLLIILTVTALYYAFALTISYFKPINIIYHICLFIYLFILRQKLVVLYKKALQLLYFLHAEFMIMQKLAEARNCLFAYLSIYIFLR